jgi:pimeloyl-ACP methyl ester carboxylesterase
MWRSHFDVATSNPSFLPALLMFGWIMNWSLLTNFCSMRCTHKVCMNWKSRWPVVAILSFAVIAAVMYFVQPDVNTQPGRVTLSTGLSTAVRYDHVLGAAPHTAIFGHGLGSKDPLRRGHDNDKWIDFMREAVISLPTNVVAYTARGHGDTTGWEATAETNPEQFTWRYLANDMLAVADANGIDTFIAGGSSMGSATSLFAAIKAPTRVKALILVRPPTAWQERLDRRKFLLGAADRLKESMEKKHPTSEGHSTGNVHSSHFVLRGTAYSDLPPLDSNEYHQIRHIPTLILTIKDDPAHPVSTAEALHSVLPQSKLYVAEEPAQAFAEWPAVIQEFVNSLRT